MRFTLHTHRKKTKSRLTKQRPSASPANSSRILSVLVYLRSFRESSRSSTLDSTVSTTPPDTGLCDVVAQVDVGLEHADSSNEAADVTNDEKPCEDKERIDHENNDNKTAPNGSICQYQSKFLPAYLADGDDSETEVEDLIPTEYNLERAENMIHSADEMANHQCMDDNEQALYLRTPSNNFENSPAAYHTTNNPAKAPLPLSEAMLVAHTICSRGADEMRDIIPQGPYKFMADPNHPAPEVAVCDNQGVGIHCPDGCADCEITANDVFRSKRRVHEWFEKYASLYDLQITCWNYQQQHITAYLGDFTDTGEFDLLYGATEATEFCWMQRFYEVEEPVRMHPSELVIAHMKRAEILSSGLFSYFHGFDYNAIVAEYEPRYLPGRAVSFDKRRSIPIKYQQRHDPIQPIWEARGRIKPGQTEAARMECARKEYRRRWIMYREQDEARRRYVDAVLREAAEEHALAMRAGV